MQNGSWQKEERISNPFKKDADFDLRIRVHDEAFEITADQKTVHKFKYRLPASSVDHFSVTGDCKLSGIHWSGRYYTLPHDQFFHEGSLPCGKHLI